MLILSPDVRQGTIDIIPTGSGKMLSTSFYKGFKAACFTAAAVASFQASADIVISGTRIVYQQSQKDVIVSLDNRGKKPLLVQSWLDDGRDDTNPQELKLPFIITPPVSPKRSIRSDLVPGWFIAARSRIPILVQCARDSTEVKSERR